MKQLNQKSLFKILIAIVLLIISINNTQAAIIPIDLAESLGSKYYFQQINRLERYQAQKFEYSNLQIESRITEKENNLDLFHIFNYRNGGFVIVSAHDNVAPIIGYSFLGSLNPENYSPTQKWWMQHYKDQINNAVINNLPADENAKNAWNELKNFRIDNYQAPKSTNDIEPLVGSVWNQDDPYNLLCPADPIGPGGHVYAGCVATAMSQIIYYYRYPNFGTGSSSYTHPTYGYQSVNHATTNYNFYGMSNTIDINNYYDIALLQYHCGVAVEMDYGNDGSGAFSIDADDAFRDHFGYTSAVYRSKSNYTATNWENMLVSNLDLKHPVYYSGYDPAPDGGGHAFVFDGYQGSAYPRMYHINWGWSGSGDGYFLLTDMNSGNGSYTDGHGMVANIYPPAASYPIGCTGQKSISSIAGTIDDGSGHFNNYSNNLDCKWLIAPEYLAGISTINIGFEKFDTELNHDSLIIYDGPTENSPILGVFSGNTLPDAILSSNDSVLIRFITDGTNNYGGWFINYSANAIVHCINTITLTAANDTFTDGSGDDYYYRNNSNCKWKLQPPGATSITLNFEEFNTENTNDRLRVYDKASGGTLVATLSGSNLPASITSSNGSMYLIFTTDGTNIYPGWKANYTSNSTVDLNESTINETMVVFVDQAEKTLNLDLFDVKSKKYKLDVLNLIGQNIYHKDLGLIEGNYQHKINLANQAQGIYTLVLSSEKGSVVRKVVLK